VRGVKDNDSVMFITAGGLLTRVPARTISQIGRNTQGVRLVKLNEGDRVIATARIADGSSDESGDQSGDAAPEAPSQE
jgi:DNA gyrase subunit A